MEAQIVFPDLEQLDAVARSRSADYPVASPFPHAVIDDFLPAALAEAVLEEFPGPDSIEWEASYADERQLKLASEDESRMGPVTRRTIAYLNSGQFLRFLEQLTGIQGLIPDPHLTGGGLHQIRTGGFLKVHADFNWYERLKLHRRLNLIVYFNRDWEESYGGHLELWDAEMTACDKKILPVFNRCVVFSTTDVSFHGHPDPLACPPGQTRKSLALYYYTSDRPDSESSAPHSTLFRERPGAAEQASAEVVEKALRRERLRRSVRRWVPPVVWDGLAALRQRARR